MLKEGMVLLKNSVEIKTKKCNTALEKIKAVSAIFGVTVSSLLYRIKKNREVDIEKVYKGFIDNVTRTLCKKI